MVQLLAEYVVGQVRMSVNIKKALLGVRSSWLAMFRFHWTIGSFKVIECLERVPNISWNYVQCTLCFCKCWYNFCQTMGKIRAFCKPYMYLLRTKSRSMYLKTKYQIRMANVHFLDLLHIEYGVNINRKMPFSHIIKMAAVYKRHIVQVPQSLVWHVLGTLYLRTFVGLSM